MAHPIAGGDPAWSALSESGVSVAAPTTGRPTTVPQYAAQVPGDMHPSPLQPPSFLHAAHLPHMGMALAAAAIFMSAAIALALLFALALMPAARTPSAASPTASVRASTR